MAEFDYTAMKAIAHQILSDFGGGEQQMTFRRRSHTVSAYSAATGNQTVTETAYLVTGVILSMSPHDLQAIGMTLSENRRIILSANELTFQPEPGDEIDFQGETWRVIDGARAQPSAVGANMVYQITVRRSG